MRTSDRQGAMLPLRAYLCICVLLRRGRFWLSNSLLEGKCLVYWSHSYTLLSWGSWGFPPERLFESNCIKRRQMPLQRIGEIERVQYNRRILLLPPPWRKAEGAADTPSSNQCRRLCLDEKENQFNDM